MIKTTPLRDEHVALGARMVDFAGWYMPVEYEGLRAEHMNVRENVGLFDVSHMGEIRVKGENALATVQWLTSNDAAKLNTGQAQYSLFPNEDGGVVDDLIVYCVNKGSDYLLCVNASNSDKDFAWVVKNNRGAQLTNESEKWGQIAVQGPKALQLIDQVLGPSAAQIPTFEFRPIKFQSSICLVARTGYTGEDGAEIFVPKEATVALWKTLMSEGAALGVKPIGLGARDTLRTEMKYSLYGHEIDDTTNPYAAGLGWVVKPEAKDFIGRTKIVEQKEQGLKSKLIGFKMLGKMIARQGYKVMSFDNREIGKVTSGTPSPSLGANIGIAYVDKDFSKVGTKLNIDIRGKMFEAEVVATPFVNKTK
jgi:aminomethyltransferase